MGIEYMIDLACRPKQELGEEHMINLAKQARKQAPRAGMEGLETAQVLDVPTEYAGDDQEQAVRKELAKLDYYLSDCMSCPANVNADTTSGGPTAAFGCHMELEYPIRAPFETVLLKAAVEALEHPEGNPGAKLVGGILKSHAKGRKTPAHKVRKMGRDYFESKTAQAAKLTVGGEKVAIDTDQLMTLLMLGPVPAPATGAFAVLIDKGLERAAREGVQDPRTVKPVRTLADMMKAARKTGSQVKVSY